MARYLLASLPPEDAAAVRVRLALI